MYFLNKQKLQMMINFHIWKGIRLYAKSCKISLTTLWKIGFPQNESQKNLARKAIKSLREDMEVIGKNLDDYERKYLRDK